jgi:glycosyltransferase involved in cell wall biosynthesis
MSAPLRDKLTVVIPCYNEEQYIADTLYSLHNQTNNNGLRVIVADSQSTDKTREVVRILTRILYPKLRIELIEGGKVAYGRNEGAHLVKTKYILFLDADCQLPARNNLDYNIDKMEESSLDLLTCKITSRATSIRSKIAFLLFNLVNRVVSLKTPFAVGGYFLTRRDKFECYGRFDQTLSNSEDYWLSKKYSVKKFCISKMTYSQDDRRFKKMGYLGLLKLLVVNYINRDNIEFFRKDVGYWD